MWSERITEKPDSGRTGKNISNLGFRRGRWLFSQDLGFGIWYLGFGIWETRLQNPSIATSFNLVLN